MAMKSTLQSPPDRPQEWAGLVTEQAAELAQKSEVIEQKSQVIAEQKRRIELLGSASRAAWYYARLDSFEQQSYE